MKKASLILVIIIMLLPFCVYAANGSISIQSSNTVMVGNNITVTVTIAGKNGSKMSGWEADLEYDKKLLSLSSSTTGNNGTHMVGYLENASGVSSKKYTFTFKALQSGNARISINSFSLLDLNEQEMKTSGASKTISIKTKEQIEASYSDNANLKSLTVSNYSLTPAFSKSVKEYNVEVPNDVESVTISALKEDANASVSGAGEKTLVEGNNKFEIVVTAQKGNSQTYVVNVYRKELNPISVSVDDKNYTLVRKAENLPEYKTFVESTATYEDTEIPSLYNQKTGMVLIGVKDDDGNVSTYIYEDGKITDLYVELDNYAFSLLPLKLKESNIFKDYTKKSVDISGIKVEAYSKSDSKYIIIYAQNVETGEENYYSYFISDGTFQVYNDDVRESYEKRFTNFKYVLYGLVGVILIQFLILIIRKPKRKKDKELVKKIDDHINEEIKEEINNKEVKKDKNKEKELDLDTEENSSEIKLVKSEKK